MKPISGAWVLPAIFILFAGITACKKDVEGPDLPPKPSPNSKATFTFTHSVDGKQVLQDSIMFINLSSNEYSVKSLQYLISDIRLDDLDGNFRELDEYHFVDLFDVNTHTFLVTDSIKKGKYKAINYFIGFLPEKNVTSGAYPELDAAGWAFPPVINGVQAEGYYAMKMTGRYLAAGDTVPHPYDMGIGAKILETNPTSKYVPNPIVGSIDASSIDLDYSKVNIELRFNIARIFSNPSGGNQIDLELYDVDYEIEPTATEKVSSNISYALSLGIVKYGDQE